MKEKTREKEFFVLRIEMEIKELKECFLQYSSRIVASPSSYFFFQKYIKQKPAILIVN
jgi:hypothetical protein